MKRVKIKVGDIYQDCAHHPVLCTASYYFRDEPWENNVEGISLIDGSWPRHCSVMNCVPRKISIKQEKSQGWTGEKNPNFFNFSVDKKLEILDYVFRNHDKTMKEISMEFGISLYVMRKMFLDLGVNNIQEMRRRKDIEDFFRELKNKLCKTK